AGPQRVHHRRGVAQVNVGAGRLAGRVLLSEQLHQRLHVAARRELRLDVQAVFLVHVGDDLVQARATAEARRRPLRLQDGLALGALDELLERGRRGLRLGRGRRRGPLRGRGGRGRRLRGRGGRGG